MISWEIHIKVGEVDPNRGPITDLVTDIGIELTRAGVEHEITVRHERTNRRLAPLGAGEQQPTERNASNADNALESTQEP